MPYRKYIIGLMIAVVVLAILKVAIFMFTPENSLCYEAGSEDADGCQSALIPGTSWLGKRGNNSIDQ